jgi:hypothetical protein
MSKLKKTLYLALIASEASHVFCCVLPTVFSIIGLLAGLGMVGVMPLWLDGLHTLIHSWEVPIILFSGAIICFGWAVHLYSARIDCHDHGCAHGPCAPTKKKSSMILKIATLLFLVNVIVFGVFHRGMKIFVPETPIIQEYDSHHDHAH